jgi:endoglucanase
MAAKKAARKAAARVKRTARRTKAGKASRPGAGAGGAKGRGTTKSAKTSAKKSPKMGAKKATRKAGGTPKATKAAVVRPALAGAERRLREAFLLEVTSLPTAAGREVRVVEFIERWVAARAERLVLARDEHGNLTVARHDFLESCARGAKPLLITAHLDHPAFVVTSVRAQGKVARLELEFRGGVNDPYFKGAELEVFDRATERSFAARIESLDATTDPAAKPFKTVVARLARAADAAHIAPGSIARWKFARAEVKDGLAHTHACDDLAALAAALVAFDAISRDASLGHVALLFTRSEEIGFIGAIGAARSGTVPAGARLLCLENSRSFPHDSPIGAGPIVRVGDRLSVFTPELTNRVGDIAAAHAKAHPETFRFQRKLMPGGACEATAFASFGLASTCVCLPLGNYHNMQDIDGVAAGKSKARVGREFIACDDFHWLVELLEAVARKLDSAEFAAGHRALMDTLWTRHARIVGENARGA